MARRGRGLNPRPCPADSDLTADAAVLEALGHGAGLPAHLGVRRGRADAHLGHVCNGTRGANIEARGHGIRAILALGSVLDFRLPILRGASGSSQGPSTLTLSSCMATPESSAASSDVQSAPRERVLGGENRTEDTEQLMV